MLKIFIIPILFFLKIKKNKVNSWRDLSNEEMILPFKNVKNKEKINNKQIVLLIILNILYFLSKFKKKKKIDKRKVSGNYYPIN